MNKASASVRVDGRDAADCEGRYRRKDPQPYQDDDDVEPTQLPHFCFTCPERIA
jgi:hypothetical protein